MFIDLDEFRFCFQILFILIGCEMMCRSDSTLDISRFGIIAKLLKKWNF